MDNQRKIRKYFGPVISLVLFILYFIPSTFAQDSNYYDVSDSSRQYVPKRLSGNNISRLNIPQSILSRPFSGLNNQDIRILVKSLREHYGH